MDWQKAEKQEDGRIQIPERWLYLYYYEALNILFRFENALRIFVYIVLKSEFCEKWDETSIGKEQTIRSETKKRISQAKEHGYLGYEVTSPMLYLNSGELIYIINSESHWKLFSKYFKASKSIVMTKLQEIGTVRNSLAHFRPIKEDDIDLIKQNSKHVLLEIENCLVQLTSIQNLVPSNSEEPWYKSIKSIGSTRISTALYTSKDSNWIRVQISYHCPVFRKWERQNSYLNFMVGNLQTQKILSTSPEIKKSCIYMSENPVFASIVKNNELLCRKEISFIFSKRILERSYTKISEEIKDIALRCDSESELLLNDNLAAGDLVDAKSITAHLKKFQDTSYWVADTKELKIQSSEIEDVELWGSRAHFVNDFISGSSNYPWMPSSISEDEIPF